MDYETSLLDKKISRITAIPKTRNTHSKRCLLYTSYLSKIIKGYDSLVSVKELKNFLLNQEGKLVNNTTNIPWPRTQDLEPLYEINHAIFLAKRSVYTEQKNRIGQKTLLYIMDEIHSKDIDWEEDFKIAEIMYKTRCV